ncbi:flavodoxin, short chain [Anaerosphaera aminiphila DSM 21120]|uniref:Flavodoxin n=1 Tax=Anaerosphaera aminiphila DSM 21120 TaxID=1120995 RepID=A0A1M5NVE7_9FIRM|nr:flavodoxin [Anaerosphaera aminiphila]SHG92953.1 flavodoxin, short chain [Anaerosphaera aminiphila DSM 21120]
MKKVNIIYWTGTGNTEIMANAMGKGAEGAGAEVKIIEVGQATEDDVKSVNNIAFGCPAMGAEELEETEMRPFMDKVNSLLAGKNVVIFGSYEWADGEWMRSWQDEIMATGCKLIADGFIAYDSPDEDAIDECESLGKDLANA